MPDILPLVVINLALLVAASFCAYKVGQIGERIRHYEWMSEGWTLAADHIDFIMLTQPTHVEALERHLVYMTDVFSVNRPYPPKKEVEPQ